MLRQGKWGNGVDGNFPCGSKLSVSYQHSLSFIHALVPLLHQGPVKCIEHLSGEKAAACLFLLPPPPTAPTNSFFVLLLLFSSSVMSNSLQLHGLQHARLPHPSPTPRACSNSCPLSWWCHPTISSCHPLLLLPSVFPSIRVFSNESVLHIRWPKYWSFSISPSNEYSGLISFRLDWFDLLAIQGTLRG